jgi:WW domain-containing oxidoreductase
MSLYGLIKPKGPSGFGYSSTAEEVTAGLSLAGKTILVTGCNSGLGFETMRVLALRGARVLGAARTEAKARSAATVSGAYFANCNVAVPRSDANDPALAAKLWEVSGRIVAELSA